MTEMQIGVVVIVAFGLGWWMGQKLEARLWRNSASDFLRVESGGRIYVVHEDCDRPVHLDRGV